MSERPVISLKTLFNDKEVSDTAIFQIVYQDPEFTDWLEITGIEGIISEECPEWDADECILYLRGRATKKDLTPIIIPQDNLDGVFVRLANTVARFRKEVLQQPEPIEGDIFF